jgi:hypothetical protein
MTLNVRLEEVPDAILEAVMARILRNRQKLQDNQQQIQRPLLQPKPQVRNQGADNRTWRKPEPAAVALDSKKELVIYWTEEGTPASTVRGVTFENMNLNPGSLAPPFGTELHQGVLASSNLFMPAETLTFKSPNLWNLFPIRGQKWTIEFWAKWETSGYNYGYAAAYSSEPPLVNYRFEMNGRPYFGDPICTFDPELGAVTCVDNVLNYGEANASIDGLSSSNQDEGFQALTWSQENIASNTWHHKSIQRIGNFHVVHVDGQPESIEWVGGEAQPYSFAGGFDLETGGLSFGGDPDSVVSALGQIRIINSARYGVAPFVPPPQPFYTPPTP